MEKELGAWLAKGYHTQQYAVPWFIKLRPGKE